MLIKHLPVFGVVVGQCVVSSITGWRLLHRLLYVWTWWDDLLVTAAVCLNIPLVLRSFWLALSQTPSFPLHYRLEWGASFFVIWFSRGSLIMSATRVQKDSDERIVDILLATGAGNHRKDRFIVPWIMTGIALVLGTMFALFAGGFCSIDATCTPDALCICQPPRLLFIFALIAELVMDALICRRNWVAMVRETKYPFSIMPLRTRIAVMGFHGNLLIFLSNFIGLCIYMTQASHSHNSLSAVYLTNSAAIVSIFAANISSILGFLFGNHRHPLTNSEIRREMFRLHDLSSGSNSISSVLNIHIAV